MPAREVLETASALVTGDRASAHGSIPETHENIARLWNGYMYNKDELTASRRCQHDGAYESGPAEERRPQHGRLR
jgi:hypothetical protein